MNKLILSLQSASLAVVLGLAVTVVTLLTGQIAPGVYIDIMKSRMTAEEHADFSKSWAESIAISPEGQPLIQQCHFNRGQFSNRTIELLDLEHNPIKEPMASEWNERLLPWSVIASANAQVLKYVLDKPIPRGMRVTRMNWDHEKMETWYFVYGGPTRGQGLGWFEGYNRRTRSLLGHLGTRGFTDHKPQETECFQVITGMLRNGMKGSPHMLTFEKYSEYRETHLNEQDDIAFDGKPPTEQSQILILSAGKVWSVDLKERTVQYLSEDTSVQTIGIAQRLEPQLDERPAGKQVKVDNTKILHQFVALRLDDRIKFINPKLGVPFELQIPDEMRNRALIYYLLQDGSMIVESLHVYGAHKTKTQRGIFERNHKIVRVYPDATQESRVLKTNSSAKPEMISESAWWWISVWQVPAPMASLLIATLGHAAIQSPDIQLSFYNIMLNGFENAWPALVALCLFSGILVWLTDRWFSNHRMQRNHAWLAFVFLFGLPGFIGFLMHRKWPVNTPAPSPEKTGIEVFA